MKVMNCTKAEELLPLYAGRDLDESDSSRLAAHLQECTQCTQSWSLYLDARECLLDCAPPSFPDEVYDDLRRSVMLRIEASETKPTLLQIATGLFQLRVALATSVALVVLASLLFFYFVDSPSDRGILADEKGNKRTVPALQTPEPQVVEPEKRVEIDVPKSNQDLYRAENKRTPKSRVLIDARNPENAGDQTNLVATGSADSTNELAVSKEPLRMEFQTGDPNIRIIWFAQQPEKDGPVN